MTNYVPTKNNPLQDVREYVKVPYLDLKPVRVKEMIAALQSMVDEYGDGLHIELTAEYEYGNYFEFFVLRPETLEEFNNRMKAIEKAKEQRRKTYEKLKAEFEGE